jgi:hypothetical protein
MSLIDEVRTLVKQGFDLGADFVNEFHRLFLSNCDGLVSQVGCRVGTR